MVKKINKNHKTHKLSLMRCIIVNKNGYNRVFTINMSNFIIFSLSIFLVYDIIALLSTTIKIRFL